MIISADSRQTRLKGETNDGKMIELSLKGQREKMVDLIENIGGALFFFISVSTNNWGCLDRKKKLFRYTVGSFNVAVALLGDPAEAKTKIGFVIYFNCSHFLASHYNLPFLINLIKKCNK